jgi:hypothetical protein
MIKIYKNYGLESGFQAIETLIDSASQRLAFLHGKDDPETRKVISALKIIRMLQSKHYPVKTRSIKRSIDSIDKNGNYNPHLSKQNYPKYKKMRDIKKGLQKTL